MELTDIMALVKAGYTKNEIEQMQNPVQNNAEPVPVVISEPTPEPEPVQAQVTEPVAVAEPKPVAVPVQTPAQVEPSTADLMKEIAKLTSAVQANAIAHSVIPGGMPHQPTAEDMLAEIIKPTYKERS